MTNAPKNGAQLGAIISGARIGIIPLPRVTPDDGDWLEARVQVSALTVLLLVLLAVVRAGQAQNPRRFPKVQTRHGKKE